MNTGLATGLNRATPRLLLDADRLEQNAALMRRHCAALGVTLRPHVKTSKSIDVALVAAGGQRGPITVSTLAEAEHFAKAGWTDILYATAITPSKVARVDQIQKTYGRQLLLVIDDAATATALGKQAAITGADLGILIEVDCGEHRSGTEPASDELLSIAAAIGAAAPHIRLLGVMTHAGHSYALNDPADIAALAETERLAAVSSAELLRRNGFPSPIVSVGSTPTALFAETLEGVTEVRAGIYLFWDLAQLSRRICEEENLAVSVLATVIGHQHRGPSLVLDAGALALSKDVGANRFMADAGYGWVCDVDTLERLDQLAVATVHQEHGAVPVPDESWFERLPIGSLVRIIPNHACLTCAAYPAYDVLRGGEIVGEWQRTGGW